MSIETEEMKRLLVRVLAKFPTMGDFLIISDKLEGLYWCHIVYRFLQTIWRLYRPSRATISPAAPLIIWKTHHKTLLLTKKICSNVEKIADDVIWLVNCFFSDGSSHTNALNKHHRRGSFLKTLRKMEQMHILSRWSISTSVFKTIENTTFLFGQIFLITIFIRSFLCGQG